MQPPLTHLLLGPMRRTGAFRLAEERLAAGSDVTLAAAGIARPALMATLFSASPRPTLAVIAGEEAAERLGRQLAAYLPAGTVMRFPERRELPWSDSAPDLEVIGRRARALHALAGGQRVVVVASARALLRALPPQGSHVFEPLVLQAGSTIDLADAAERLARMGYERVDTASGPGDFAVRGGVLDVFGSDATHPIRAEFLGDSVESLRRYVPSTGQSIGPAERTEVFGCREVALGVRASGRARRALETAARRDPLVAHHLELLEEGVYFNGVERYLPMIYERPGLLTDYLSAEALVVVVEPTSLFNDATRRHEELSALAGSAGERLDGLYIPPARLDLGGRQRLTLLSLLRASGTVDAEMAVRRPDVAGGEAAFVAGLRALAEVDYSIVLAVPERRSRRHIESVLADGGLSVRDLAEEALQPRVVHLSAADVPAGFVVSEARLAVVSVDDVYPRSAAARRARRDVDVTKLTFDFAPGDYVVHATHGIALFREMQHKQVLGSERDYLALEYAKGDRLYVPVEQIDRVTKYVGPEGAAPRLTRLNTADWSRATTRARKAAKTLAFDLVDLYARRAAATGRVFSPDTPWQFEMEAMFPFEETSDQLAAIADVKADMEAARPMDRLICGDVGYGKTEVAIRAAFKAAQDSAQVMVLCPTTILAQQHYTTFSERFEPFGVRVEVLSRFRSPAEQQAALEGFTSGSIDVLIGTHRLLSADVAPRNLGLVIVDEEQRFGVEHKEHLKNLREQLDVLTLTATPIPRTLQMSLSGVRDLSVIDTPPPNRFPVSVHVGEYDADVVSGAVRRELERGGQVYYVSNRVRSIQDAVERVREAAPEARIGVAHGQMSENQLEGMMERFAANEIDVLVATTIIESGIDNPHTNTLVIEDSQRLGLAQLYQLKGRVGRSHVRAFAYFLFPRGASLTEQAAERLSAIRENAELGSGIKVAMRDLEIRGAGSLLGADQHGNMGAVGFDLFAEMLRSAVAEARGEPDIAHPEIRVDLPVPAFLPEEYVPAVDERVRFYRRLAGSSGIESVARIVDEIRERFGELPAPARNLADVARIRALAAEAGAGGVSVVRKRLIVGPLDLSVSLRGALATMGAVWLERERSVALPIEYGGSVTASTLAILDAILSGANTE